MSVEDFRKTVLLKAMMLKATTNEKEFVEVTVKIPKYIASAVSLCTYCWVKNGKMEEVFDDTISCILDDGVRLRFTKEFGDDKDALINAGEKLTPQCVLCIVSGRDFEINGNDKSNGKAIRSDGQS